MRYGVYLANDRARVRELLDKAIKGDVIWSNQTVKGLLTDLLTLHDEVKHLETEVNHHRVRRNTAVRGAPRGW